VFDLALLLRAGAPALQQGEGRAPAPRLGEFGLGLVAQTLQLGGVDELVQSRLETCGELQRQPQVRVTRGQCQYLASYVWFDAERAQ
jgi:hypothetical protein